MGSIPGRVIQKTLIMVSVPTLYGSLLIRLALGHSCNVVDLCSTSVEKKASRVMMTMTFVVKIRYGNQSSLLTSHLFLQYRLHAL